MSGRTGHEARPSLAALLAAAVSLAACVPTPLPPGTLPPAAASGPTLPPTTEPSPTAPALPSASPAPTEAPGVAETVPLEAPAGLGRSPADLAVLDGRVYVACVATASICRLEEGALAGCTRIGGWLSALAAAPGGGPLYALDEIAGTIRLLDGEQVVETWPAPNALSLAHDGSLLWVGGREGRLAALTPEGEVSASTSLEGGGGVLAIAPSPDGVRLYAATFGRVHALDAATGDVVGAAEVEGLFRALAVSPGGETVYVTTYDASAGQPYLVALEAATLAPRRRTPIAADPAEIVVDPATGRVFVLSSTRGEVAVYDATLAALAILPVGLGPLHLAIDPAARRVYASVEGSDNVYAIDADRLVVAEVVPLTGRYVDLATDPASGRAVVAAASADRLIVIGPGGEVHEWPLATFPFAVLPIPEEGLVAALTRNPPRLWLLSPEDGSTRGEYPIAPRSGGLHYDAAKRALYAGSVRLDLASGHVDEVAAHSPRGTRETPRGYVWDSRRGRMYAIAHNGIPGSNGGDVLASLDPDAGPAPASRVGITAAVYDAATDRLYTASRRMAACALAASSAEDGTEILGLRFAGCPEHLALVEETGHLWVAVNPPPAAAGGPPAAGALVIGLDAETLGRVAEIPIEGRVDGLAVDAANGRVLVGDGETGEVVVIQDISVPAPPPPSPTPTWTPYPVAPPAP